jgi:hypothetical protein
VLNPFKVHCNPEQVEKKQSNEYQHKNIFFEREEPVSPDKKRKNIRNEINRE